MALNEASVTVTVNVGPPHWSIDVASSTPLVEVVALMVRFKCLATAREHGGARLFTLIVDRDPAPTGEQIIEALSTGFSGVQPVRYVGDPASSFAGRPLPPDARSMTHGPGLYGIDYASGPDRTVETAWPPCFSDRDLGNG